MYKEEYAVYKHMKSGGLYYPLDFHVRKKPADADMDYYYKMPYKAIVEATMEEVDIYAIYSDSMGLMGYTYDADIEHQTFVLYEGVDGKKWLRPRMEFFSLVNGTPRFVPLKSRATFDNFISLLNKE